MDAKLDNVVHVVTGVKWIKGFICWCACLTESLVRGRHLDRSAITRQKEEEKRICKEYLHLAEIAWQTRRVVDGIGGSLSERGRPVSL